MKLLSFLCILFISSLVYSVIEVTRTLPKVVLSNSITEYINKNLIKKQSFIINVAGNKIYYTNLLKNNNQEFTLPKHNRFSVEFVDQRTGHVFAILDNSFLVITNENDVIQDYQINLIDDSVAQSRLIDSLIIKKSHSEFQDGVDQYKIQYVVQDNNNLQNRKTCYEIMVTIQIKPLNNLDSILNEHNSEPDILLLPTWEFFGKNNIDELNEFYNQLMKSTSDSNKITATSNQFSANSDEEFSDNESNDLNRSEISLGNRYEPVDKMQSVSVPDKINDTEITYEPSVSIFSTGERKTRVTEKKRKARSNQTNQKKKKKRQSIRKARELVKESLVECNYCNNKKLMRFSKKKNGCEVYYCKKCIKLINIYPGKKTQKNRKIIPDKLDQYLEKRKQIKEYWNEYHNYRRGFPVPYCTECKVNLHVFPVNIRKLKKGISYRYSCFACHKSLGKKLSNTSIKVTIIGIKDTVRWTNALNEYRKTDGKSPLVRENDKKSIQCLHQCGNNKISYSCDTTDKGIKYALYYCTHCFSSNLIPKDPKRNIISRTKRDPQKRKEKKIRWNRYYELERKQKLLDCTECKSNLHIYNRGKKSGRYYLWCHKCNCANQGDLFNRYIKVIPFNKTPKWEKRLQELTEQQNENARLHKNSNNK